jgi:hypothetical protein
MNLLQSDNQNRTILVPQHIEIRELAELLHLKPFRVVADVLELKQFKRADDLIDFTTAATVAQKHGYAAGKSSWGTNGAGGTGNRVAVSGNG